MVDLVEFLWNLSFCVSSFLLQSLLALRKVMSTAVSSKSPTPASSPLPWKRFADTSLLASKKARESPVWHRACHAHDGSFSQELHLPQRRELVLPLPISWKPPQDSALRHGEDPTGYMRDREDGVMSQRSPVQTAVADRDHAAAGTTGDGRKVGCPRVRRRPTRIAIPESDAVSGFNEVGKVETNGEFQAGGSFYCVAGRRGNRRITEDGYAVLTNVKGDAKQAYFGVFDGHGGRAAVDYVSEKLGENIMTALGQLDREKGRGDPEMAVIEGYLTTDREFLTKGVGSGACAATVLLKDGELHAANAGDCRIVMSRKGLATALTTDHRPLRDDERARIENSGGYVSCHNGIWRVQGSLAVSRAIGDLHVKDWIISEPETRTLQLTEDCDFLIMASDGLWDKVSNEEAVDVVAKHKNLPESCKRLVDLSSGRGCKDDITVMVVDLHRFLRDSQVAS